MLIIEQFSRMLSCDDVNELRELAYTAFNPAVDRNREAGSSSSEHNTTAGLFTFVLEGQAGNVLQSDDLETGRMGRGDWRQRRCLLAGDSQVSSPPWATEPQQIKQKCAVVSGYWHSGVILRQAHGSVVKALLCRDDISLINQ